ncbi:hypothetical protein D918_09523 [Trichuris suis]|nr:hypothetical protein D918_09523 [Trichuris suis]
MPSIVISNYSISAKLLLEVLLVMGTRVYIGRLPYRATERDIERFFRGYGRIREIFLKNGYGFIEFEDYRDADDACVELNGREMLGERSLEARRMAVTGLAGVHRIHLITGDERRGVHVHVRVTVVGQGVMNVIADGEILPVAGPEVGLVRYRLRVLQNAVEVLKRPARWIRQQRMATVTLDLCPTQLGGLVHTLVLLPLMKTTKIKNDGRNVTPLKMTIE